MNGKPFFDTNILIYTLAKTDPREHTAQSLLLSGGVVSVHVLNEFVSVVRRKYKLDWNEVREALADFKVLCPGPTPITGKTHEAALGIAERYGYGIYDALVIAAALEASCGILYSEDLQDGQEIQGLTIRNPFKPAPQSAN